MADWIDTGGLRSLKTPHGTAVLTHWTNPIYIHGVIVFAEGPPVHIPNTSWFGSERHMPAHLRRKYPTAWEAAQAYAEWVLQSTAPAGVPPTVYDMLGDK